MANQNKGNEDIKASLDGCLKSLSDQFGKAYEEKFKEILLVFSTLPVQTEASLLKLQNKLCNFLDEKLQACMILQRKVPNSLTFLGISIKSNDRWKQSHLFLNPVV